MKTVSFLGVLTLAAMSSAPARGDGTTTPPVGSVDKAACLDAVAKGQRLRDTHKLVEAREELRVCARAECPSVVQSDCATWLGELDRTLPTVVLSAKDGAGRDVMDVKVSVDGQPLTSVLDGQAVAVDPGLRTFRFERRDGSVATQQVLVKEGEKARGVWVVLAGAGGAAAAPAASPVWAKPDEAGVARPPPTPSPSTLGSTRRLLALALGGAGVAGLGAGAGIALDAKSRDNRAAGESGIARQTDSSSAVSEGNAATVVVCVGAAMAAAGVLLWLTAPSSRALAVGTSGREVILRGSF